MTLGLLLICHSSFRGVVELLRDCFDLEISIGTVYNVVRQAVKNAGQIQSSENLSAVKVGAHDEIFQGRSPVLVGADVFSTYCYLLAPEKSRDAETWGIRMMELSDKGMKPDHTIADGGKGLRAGQAPAWPDVPCKGDVFHALLDSGRLSMYLENRALGALSAEQALAVKMARAKKRGRGNRLSKRIAPASRHAADAVDLADDVANDRQRPAFNQIAGCQSKFGHREHQQPIAELFFPAPTNRPGISGSAALLFESPAVPAQRTS